jgi:hypothetical protein
MRTAGWWVVSVVVVAAIAPGAMGQTSAPALPAAPGAAAPSPAPSTSPEMLPFLKAIREANTVAAAAEAYTGGGAIDRRNVELNQAYLRRLLQLGQPQTAGIPAAVLASIPVSDGMACGVVGYNCARQNDLPRALTSTMQAAGLLSDDNSIQGNLGQLVAWYEGAKTFKLSATDQGSLDRLKTILASKPAYAAGYEAIKGAFDKQADGNSQGQQKVAAAETDVQAAEKKVADVQAKIKSLTDEEAADVKTRDVLERQPAAGRAQPGRRPGAGGGNNGNVNNPQLARINAAIVDIDNNRMPQAKKDLQDATTALTQKKQALEKLRGKPPETASLSKAFHWLPPAVDGVVTLPPDAASKPAASPAPSAAASN